MYFQEMAFSCKHYLSRHWPEEGYLLSLNSVTLEKLLIEYGSPAGIATDAENAAKSMRLLGEEFAKRCKNRSGHKLCLQYLGTALYRIRIALFMRHWQKKCSIAGYSKNKPNKLWKNSRVFQSNDDLK